MNPASATPEVVTPKSSVDIKRYIQFVLLLLAAGAIYPLLYLRQNFETSILEVFQITSGDLGNYYSMLGIMYFVCYLPSGWLADRVSPRILVAISMMGTGLVGFWFSTIPSKDVLVYLFMAWGIFAGLTFWASMIKGVKMLAKKNEQGRFFGILDGGRGLVEAVLATIAIAIFAYVLETQGQTSRLALQQVIYMYSAFCIAIGVLVLVMLNNNATEQDDNATQVVSKGNLIADLKYLASIPEMWLVALVILCGYQLFWATYSFSAFLQEGHGVSAVTAGIITVAKLWMRPIGGIGAGILGDKYGKENILALSLAGATAALLLFTLFPQLSSMYLLLGLVLLIGVLTYAIRGLYWSILDNCHIPMHVTGLAIGVISLVAYTPDIFLPQINAYFAARYEGLTVYQFYFGYIALMGVIGVLAVLKLKQMNIRKTNHANA